MYLDKMSLKKYVNKETAYLAQRKAVVRYDLQVILKPIKIDMHAESSLTTHPSLKKTGRMKEMSDSLDGGVFLGVVSKSPKMTDKAADSRNKRQTEKSNTNVKDKMLHFKRLIVKIIPLENSNIGITKQNLKKPPVNIANTDLKKHELPKLKRVHFEQGLEKKNEMHNLRRLEPKNYIDDSILDSSADLPKDKLLSIDLKKKDAGPIYKKVLPDELKTPSKDLYEFIDFSPKAKKVPSNRRQHRSSILFDKDTHEIMRKLEEKEAKVKKKVGRKKSNLEKKKKSYDKTIDKILSNVMGKIAKKNKSPVGSVAETVNVHHAIHTANTSIVEPKDQNLRQDSHVMFQEEINNIIHSSPEVPSSNKRTVPEVSENKTATNTLTNDMMVTTRKPIVNREVQSGNNGNFLNISDIDPILLQSIGSCDNSVSQKDIDSCFGFEDIPVPISSTPAKSVNKDPVNIINNVVLRRGNHDLASPTDFDVRRPNANSTMLHTKAPHRTSSPWRGDWISVRHNPYFINVKSNALPRIDQELVLDHTLVESYDNGCSKTPRKQSDTPVKKHEVQQSILEYVDSNIENENVPLQGSLFDYEAFNSPEKRTRRTDKSRVREAKRNLLGNEDNIVSSTPIQRRPLADISNSSEEVKKQNPQNVTYFGFDENTPVSLKKTHGKLKKGSQNALKENEENCGAKPSRFDVKKLKSYTKKRSNKEKVNCEADQDNSVSIFEASNDETVGEVHLFEEPEEMLDNMSPVHIEEKRHRRKRLDSCDSDTSDCDRKRKKHKKTKLEIEKEAWIKDFNKMCEEVDSHELEVE